MYVNVSVYRICIYVCVYKEWNNIFKMNIH